MLATNLESPVAQMIVTIVCATGMKVYFASEACLSSFAEPRLICCLAHPKYRQEFNFLASFFPTTADCFEGIGNVESAGLRLEQCWKVAKWVAAFVYVRVIGWSCLM